MTGNWLRRIVTATACMALLAIAGCGSSTIQSALTPTSFVMFGDSFSYMSPTVTVGPTASGSFTVNDGSAGGQMMWPGQLAASYGFVTQVQGGPGTVAQQQALTNYAQANARINTVPDAIGNASTLTVKQQVDAYLASNAPGASDVLVIQGGVGDIIAEMASVTAGAESQATMLTNLAQAGTDLGTQVRRLVNAGAKHVLVVGPYNLGRSPWASAIGQTALLQQATSQVTNALLVSVVDLGANVLYVDAAYYLNWVTGAPGSYGLTDATTVVCNSPDPSGVGIGIDAAWNGVDSAFCNTSTINANLNYTLYAFADYVYFTPTVQRLFGSYAYSQLHARW